MEGGVEPTPGMSKHVKNVKNVNKMLKTCRTRVEQHPENILHTSTYQEIPYAPQMLKFVHFSRFIAFSH